MANTPIVSASNLTLEELETRFDLNFVQEDNFFLSGLDEISELTPEEKQRLDRVEQQYLYLAKREILEEVVKIVVVSPLLDLAGFFNSPFLITAEKEVKIDDDVSEDSIRGKIYFLIVQQAVWIAIIETKRSKADVMVALPQTLTYMMASPNLEKPVFGLIVNGREAVFIKLTQEKIRQYSLSRAYSLSNPGNEFYDVLRGLRKISQILTAT